MKEEAIKNIHAIGIKPDVITNEDEQINILLSDDINLLKYTIDEVKEDNKKYDNYVSKGSRILSEILEDIGAGDLLALLLLRESCFKFFTSRLIVSPTSQFGAIYFSST